VVITTDCRVLAGDCPAVGKETKVGCRERTELCLLPAVRRRWCRLVRRSPMTVTLTLAVSLTPPDGGVGELYGHRVPLKFSTPG
jgi:hypothetical protein